MYIRDIFANRENQGELQLVLELRSDPHYHFHYFRMTKENFDELLSLVEPKLIRGKNHRLPISPLEKLAVTLRYLATGNSQVSLAFNYRISPQSVSVILRDVLKSICEVLVPLHLKKPSPQDWEANERGFSAKWNHPNCCGAIDGKHIKIQCPRFGGSEFYNYKHFHSVVLLAIVDPHYRFTVVDIGASGSQSDGGVFLRSKIGMALEKGTMGLPEPKNVGNKLLPHVIVGDDAFALKRYMMKPFPGQFLAVEKRIFNYRLSRARMVVENAFGVLSARWRIYHTPILAEMDLVKLRVHGTIILHNFIMSKHDMAGITVDSADGGTSGNWREATAGGQGMQSLAGQGSNNYSANASTVLDSFCEYCNNEGAVHWQNSRI